MSTLFFDSSALAKRYLPETGTVWVRQQLTASATAIIAPITGVEVMSAVARRQREGVISRQVMQGIRRLLDYHIQQQYTLINLNAVIIQQATDLLTQHPLRAYDAIQLATALQANQRLVARNLTALTFICADTRLLQIAQAEGLTTDNPNNYP